MERSSIILSAMFVVVGFALALAPFVLAAPTEVPGVLYPPAPPAVSEQNVPTLIFFKWQKVPVATVYAYILRPVGGDAPPQFTNGIGGAPQNEVWIQPSLAAGTNYTLSVQGCEREDINTCGPATILNFKTKDPIVDPGDLGGGGNGNGSILTDLNPISSQTLGELFENVLNFLFGLSLVLLPIVVLYAGFLLLSAGGNPQRISQGRTILLWAVIAFAVILLARGLPAVLRNLL